MNLYHMIFYLIILFLVSTSLMLIGFLFLWKALLMIPFFPKYKAFCSIFMQWKEQKSTFFIFIHWSHINFFDILLVFFLFFRHILVSVSYSLFHILFFYFFLLRINFCIYLLLYLLTFIYHFHNNISLYLESSFCFFDNMLFYSFYILLLPLIIIIIIIIIIKS